LRPPLTPANFPSAARKLQRYKYHPATLELLRTIATLKYSWGSGGGAEPRPLLEIFSYTMPSQGPFRI
jgi:hypothetical protein